MEIIEVKGSTFCIDTGMTYIPFYKMNDEEIIMLDSGWEEGEQKGIDELLEKHKFKVAGILCSHAHMDHVGNNSHFKNKYNCVIAMPATEAVFCSSPVNLKVYHGNHSLYDIIDHYGHLVCETDIEIADDQEEVDISGIKFKVLNTPGHSPAHICIVTPDDVAYLGDALISYEVMEGAKMPYAFVLREDLKSKAKLYDLKCGKYVVAHKGIYDGHNITQLITDNINFYKQRTAMIYDLIEGAMTMEELMKATLKSYSISINTRYKHSIIEKMLRSCIEYLNETGYVDLNMVEGLPKYSKSSLKFNIYEESI